MAVEIAPVNRDIPTVWLRGSYATGERFPAAMINVTNRCNLHCEHCFVYRSGNPNLPPSSVREELAEETILDTLVRLRDKYAIGTMLWMGGEPLLRKPLLEKGLPLFANNTITTNGTIPLVDFGPRVLYVVSLDGPGEVNDQIRGRGVYRRVLETLSAIPAGFRSRVQVQCVVTRKNQHCLEQLVAEVKRTRAGWMTFSFFVSSHRDTTGNAWNSLEERMHAVREVMRLKKEFPGFVRNSSRSLELMSPELAPRVTNNCPAKRHVLPLYLDGDHFVTPFCCYGNDVRCADCGAWVVFHLAALEEENGANAWQESREPLHT